MPDLAEPDLQEFVCEDHIDLAKTSLDSPFNVPGRSPPEGTIASPLWQSGTPPECQPEFCKVPLCSISAGSSPEGLKLPAQNEANDSTSLSAVEAKPLGMKRAVSDGDDETEALVRNTRPKPANRRSGRVPHSIIERRYRDNLNNQIEALRLLIPSVREAPQDVEDSLGIPPKAPSKAVVITAAASYIKELEAERSQRAAETKTLYEQVANLQQLLRCDNCSILQYLKSMQLENETELQ